MECEQCGARRPPTGLCPNCGAPPAGRSSGANWRARSGKGPAASSGRGGSGANWGGRGGSGANWGGRGGSGAGWGYDEDDGGAGRSTGRYRRPADDYQDIEQGRALVPSMDLSPAEVGMGLPGVPAVPGMAPDEVERLLGIRRPVYIPATGKKRKIRIGSWRVISGVLSLILVCVASCGIASVFGKSYLASMYRGAGVNSTPGTTDYTALTGVKGAVKGPAAKFVINAVTAKRVDASYNPIGPTTSFLVNDPVYVVVQVRNATAGSHNLCVRWYLNGQYLPLQSSAQLCVTINQPSVNAYFSLVYPQPAVGSARIYWDRPANDTNDSTTDPALAQIITFGVYLPNQPTVGPGTPTLTPGKTPSPGKTGTPGK
jgi:hypothetical protein